MQISIRTCISKYQISVAPFKTQVQGTVGALAIQNEEEEICVRDESSRPKDIDLPFLAVIRAGSEGRGISRRYW